MIGAREIVRILKGRWVGNAGSCRCPSHDDRSPSLSVREADDGKVLVRCFGGCQQGAIIDALKWHGLWAERRPNFQLPRKSKQTSRRDDQPTDDARRTTHVLAIWNSAKTTKETPVETYLASRGIEMLPPAALRFHPGPKHRSGGIWPAMVALVTNGVDGTPLAIHCTFLARDGRGKSPVEPQKMMLGPCRGGAVRLAEPSDVLMIGEGIETYLATMQTSGRATWAALSTSGRSLDLPRNVRDVIVLADGDDAGEAAAQEYARRWKGEGRRVRIGRPP